VPEDIVMELRHGEYEVDLIAAHFDAAERGGGAVPLKAGELIRPLGAPTLH